MAFIVCIAVILLIFWLLYILGPFSESFSSNLTIVDPYSLYLHNDIDEKQAWWNLTHSRKLYYYHDYVPTEYKE